MQPFVRHSGVAAPLERDNVDTDAIMPKQFMKAVARTGFGPYVFDEWRFEDAGYYGKPDSERVPKPDFVLNLPRYAGASILLTGRNFGCGSSREHAPWALVQFGFRVLIAQSFADIFFNNCCKNGLLPVVLPSADVAQLMGTVKSTPGARIDVDLPLQTVSIGEFIARFNISPYLKKQLLGGLDEVGTTLQYADDIKKFEDNHLMGCPWV